MGSSLWPVRLGSSPKADGSRLSQVGALSIVHHVAVTPVGELPRTMPSNVRTFLPRTLNTGAIARSAPKMSKINDHQWQG